jgi:hypothetical protein
LAHRVLAAPCAATATFAANSAVASRAASLIGFRDVPRGNGSRFAIQMLVAQVNMGWLFTDAI